MYEYKALITSVYDGDGAFEAVIDLGFNIQMEKTVRLSGVDTPELRGEQYEAGKKVRDFVRSLILDKYVTIRTYKDHSGKYGRLLADIQISPVEFTAQNDLGELLISMGYAKPYSGGKKDPWTKEELNKIIKDKR